MSLLSASRMAGLVLTAWLLIFGQFASANPVSIVLSGSDRDFALSIEGPQTAIDLKAHKSAAVTNVSAGEALHLSAVEFANSDGWARISLDRESDWVSGLIRHQGVLYSLERRRSGLLWLERLDARAPALRTVSHVLPLSVVIDTAYNDAFDGFGRRRAIALVNQLDGLYREQIGLGVNLLAARALRDPERDPLRQTGGTLADLLLAFRNYRQIDQTLPSETAAVHLFTGAKVFDRRMGLAYIAGACDTEGRDVSVSRTRQELVTLAHELAHSLGASHDQDSRCAVEGLLMDATVRRGASLQMSDCSVEAIQAVLKGGCFDAPDTFARPMAALNGVRVSANDSEIATLSAAASVAQPVSPMWLLLISVAALGLFKRRG